MRWRHWKLVTVVMLLAVMLCAVGYARKSKAKGETERKVTAGEVSKAALATLKKMARGAKITEFAEEIEHGSTFYEGSWKGRSGANVDVLVTDAGALVEIEQEIAANKVPAAALKAARKAAGKNVKLACERKTMILYEIKFRKGDGFHELLLTPDGRLVEKEVEKGKSDDEDKGDVRRHDDDADDDEEDDDEDDGKKVSINDVPKRVKATIVKQVKGGRIEGIERIKADGKGVYEADIIVKGKEIELIVAPNGKLLSRKVEGDAKGEDADDEDEDEDADDEDEDEDADDEDEDEDAGDDDEDEDEDADDDDEDEDADDEDEDEDADDDDEDADDDDEDEDADDEDEDEDADDEDDDEDDEDDDEDEDDE